MALSRLAVSQFRNLRALELEPSQGFNLIVGPNGSGKSSLLEAIHFLGRARSFKTSQQRNIINTQSKACTVFAEVYPYPEALKIPVGITRNLGGEVRIKVQGDDVRSVAPLAELLPLQVISPDSFKLIEGGPRSRRQFIDWGVFHVEQDFLGQWQRLNRCLKQRNKLLRRGKIDSRQLTSWDHEFLDLGNNITGQRSAYVDSLTPHFESIISRFSLPGGLKVSFYPGWDQKKGLEQALADQLKRDLDRGYTQVGPQRAELQIEYLGKNVLETASRGQQKIISCALKIAQAQLFSKWSVRKTIFLVDDLAAELDERNRGIILGLLEESRSQVFITAVEKEALKGMLEKNDSALFHVEQGALKS